MDTIETTPLGELEQKALNNVGQLLHSEDIEQLSFTNDAENETQEIAVFVGQPADTDGHMVVSTFGSGGSATTGNVKIDDAEATTPYRCEFFSVVSNRTDAYKMAEVLAKLSFIVANKGDALTPGMILGGITDENDKLNRVLLGETPLGTLGNHGVSPIITKDFAVFWIAVTLVNETESDLISSGQEGWDKFTKFYNGLDIAAYDLSRRSM
jgi:hypothetical protein